MQNIIARPRPGGSARRRLAFSYFAVLTGTIAVICAACFLANALVDPLWYFRGNVITGINYAFNERLSKVVRLLPRQQDYDCIFLGSSHTALLPADRFTGFRCFNMAFSHGRVEEFIHYARYLRDRGVRPALVVINVDKFDFEEDAPPNVPPFIRTGSEPPSVFKSYLSLDTLEFSLRTLRRDFPSRLFYDADFNMHIIPRRRYRPPVAPKVVPPFHAELAERFIALRRMFPEARAIGFTPPIVAWHIQQLDRRGHLEAYLGALERISKAFDVFLDFSIPSAATTNTTTTFDGGHYMDEVNQATVAALVAGRAPDGADWLNEPAATIRARYRARLEEMATRPLALAEPVRAPSISP